MKPLPCANVQKRYPIHIAGYSPGLIMRLLTRARTPRQLAVRAGIWLLAIPVPAGGLIVMMLLVIDDQSVALAVHIRPRRG